MSAPLSQTVIGNPARGSDLTTLLSPLRLDRFLAQHFGRSVLVLQRHDSAYYHDLMSLADLDGCLLSAAGGEKMTLQVVAAPGSGRKTTLYKPAEISKDRLYAAYQAGDTIRLIGVEQYWPPIARLAASIRGVFDSKVGVNIFLTPPRSQGFTLHFDPVDTFLVQLAGAKRWQIWEPTYERPMETELSQLHLPNVTQLDESKLQLDRDVLLEAGDLLYMPRGYYHQGTTSDDLSLHITLVLKPLYWLDLITRAFGIAALDDPSLRDVLPPGFVTEDGVRQDLAACFSSVLQRFVDRASFDRALDSLVEEEVRLRFFPPDGHFAALTQVDDLCAESMLERRSGLACSVEISPQGTAIQFGPNRVQGPLAFVLPFQFIRDHPRFRIADLPDPLTLESKLVLARRLVREGLLRPAVD